MSTGHRKDCIKSVSMNAPMSLRVFIKKKTAYDDPAARCSDLRTVSRPRVDLHLFRVLISDLYK